MAKQNDEFLKRLLATFKLEAEEHFRAMSFALLALEGSLDDEESQYLVEVLFREAHSLKGAARAVNLSPVEGVCQSLEDVLSGLKDRRIDLSAHLFDRLHQVVDGLSKMLTSTVALEVAVDHRQAADLAALLQRMQDDGVAPRPPVDTPPEKVRAPRPRNRKSNKNPPNAMAPAAKTTRAPPPTTSSEEQPSVRVETVRIATDKLAALLLQTEELLSLKYAVGQHADELRALGGAVKEWGKERVGSCRDARSLQRVLENHTEPSGTTGGLERNRVEMKRLAEALERGDLLIKSFDHQISLLAKTVEQDYRTLGGMVDRLLDDTKKILMLPFASLLEIFPKLVRDLARGQGKDAVLRVQGGEIEVAKRILEEMKDPLIHLVRNGIDHGIENPAERRRKGKPVRGQIVIAIAQRSSSKIDILVSDDGAGIDAEKVRSAAVKHGIMTQTDVDLLSDLETFPLIFRSGLSTSPMITELSGRGLGLAIVREKIEQLGGSLSVENRPDVGTSFQIVLPLTLATSRGLLVQADDRVFVVSTAHVERVIKVRQDDIKTVENRETIQLEGRTLALVRLADVLELPSYAPKNEVASGTVAVILGLGAERIAFRADRVHGEQEILVKSLGTPLARVRNIAGAAVLGTGRVAPILSVPDLMKSAVNVAAAPVASAVEVAVTQGKSILVAEDSITARTLVKNILEAAGYNVKTAVDGAEAFALLKTETFDLLVSDVEMPRMGGFELTAKIRADQRLSELPVVLVTALESREHRERGIDVGANAYLVKSSFDQSNLLEVVKRLV